MQSNIDSIINAVIPQSICDLINKKYYNKIPKEVDFAHAIHSESFLENAEDDIALFSDHGLHHIKNVAGQIPGILQCVHGIHIPKRNNVRLIFMRSYGIILGFIHDIGMSDVSLFGRAMHGEFVAQEVFKPSFAPIFKCMWNENIGNIPWHLVNLHQKGILEQDPKVVFRELLSLAVCHRKQLVPVDILNNGNDLREKMQYFIVNSLQSQYGRIKKIPISKIAEAASVDMQKHLNRFYKNFHEQSFLWLLSSNKIIKKLIVDVIDALRVLRSADALRQRGTELKTSAQFQIFISQFTANAIYALTSKDGRIYFLEVDKTINSGEANIAHMHFTNEGDLRFAFHRGFFHTEKATERAINCLRELILQLDNDISNTFYRNDKQVNRRPKLFLESTEDFPDFINRLVKKILDIKPKLAEFIEIVPSLKLATQFEYNNYINAHFVNWNVKEKRTFLKKIAASGQKTKQIELDKAFQHAKIIKIKKGEILFAAKTMAGFVYFPFSSGLEGQPTGYYSPFQVAAYTPLGNTGAIRGDIRNATIIAKKDLKLLVIPKDEYLHYWYATYRTNEFIDAIKKGLVK